MDVVTGWRDVPARRKVRCCRSAISMASIAAIRRCSAARMSSPKRNGKRSGAVVFEPHPREFFAPDQPFFRLTPLPVKLELSGGARAR